MANQPSSTGAPGNAGDAAPPSPVQPPSARADRPLATKSMPGISSGSQPSSRSNSSSSDANGARERVRHFFEHLLRPRHSPGGVSASRGGGGGGGADRSGTPFAPAAGDGGPSALGTQRNSLGRRSAGRLYSASAASLDANAPKIQVGICAMDKKARSKPMREIVARLTATLEFEVQTFGDETILNAPIEAWPIVDCLLSWYSDGFPLAKAQAYCDLRRPFLVNDLHMQDVLHDRRRVYRTLVDNGIPVPRHIIIDRDNLPEGVSDPPGFVEEADYVELDGVRIEKPFVEKPNSGEDHNIFIYYPYSMGGGVKRLFRKINDKSSCYDPNHPGTVRRDGSFIYEEFLPTGGTDVKVYTVGPRYAHAEARKSPVVDGKVLRTADGKEMRYPVLLSPQEKEIARMVSLAFAQKVCGFDLLRSESGVSYVCDVNGWSFVKSSKKYYDDAAGILRSTILAALAPHRLTLAPPPQMSLMALPATSGQMDNALLAESLLMADEERMLSQRMVPEQASMQELAALAEVSGVDAMEAARTNARSDTEELRCVLAVIRHGDRTPKQKMKMRVTQPEVLALFEKHKDSKGKQAKLKSPLQLQELLDITRALLAQLEERAQADPAPGSEAKEVDDEAREKLRIVRTVLEAGGHFSGVNRKVQLKPVRWAGGGAGAGSSGGGAPPAPAPGHGDGDDAAVVAAAAAAGAPGDGSGGGAVVAAAVPRSGGGGGATLEEAVLILKWGGVLTHAGRQQAEDLGRVFRMTMYPTYGSAGGGLLRLHSTYRHDLKIYSSDEGRVQTSAAAFTKGLLDLEGSSLTPILVSLVQKDASMLDAFGKGASDDIRAAKTTLYEAITYDPDTRCSRYSPLAAAANTLLSPPISPRHSAAGSGGGAAAPAAVPGQVAGASSAGEAAQSSFSSASSLSAMNGVAATAAAAPPPSPHSSVPGMPDNPLQRLRRLVDLMKGLVEQLRDMCMAERARRNCADAPPPAKPYSSLAQDAKDWELNPQQPCSGEKLLLVFDRWQKLYRTFYRKGRFDISKIPDIYDSAKFDAIHNTHLDLVVLPELFREAKALADAVIPNEYGIDPAGKLRIGAKICSELLGKLIVCDLEAMREESVATMPEDINGGESSGALETDLGRLHLDNAGGVRAGSGAQGGEPDQDDSFESPGTMHRLCPQYASDINSPLRHVRTRIYFTSESHIHSLLNVLRLCHTSDGRDTLPPGPSAAGSGATTPAAPPGGGSGGAAPPGAAQPPGAGQAVREGLLSEDAQELLRETTELDYLTHLVFRLYENKAAPPRAPERFRVEVLFSPGAAYDPTQVVPRNNDHKLPTMPRIELHKADGVPLSVFESLLMPFSQVKRRPLPKPYAVQLAGAKSQPLGQRQLGATGGSAGAGLGR